MMIIMATIKQTVRRTTKTRYRKSKTTKTKKGHRRCNTCGRFM